MRPVGGKSCSFALLCSLACSGLDEGAFEERPRTPDEVRTLFQQVLTDGQSNGDGLPNDTVILTYDDGPDEYTLELAQYLNQEGISATFFINGRRICKEMGDNGVCNVPMDTMPCDNGQSQAVVEDPIYYPESLLHEIVLLGHRLANHTTDHCSLPDQDNPTTFAFELQSTQEIVDRHICDGLYLFRAPYGQWDGQAAGLAQNEGMLDKLTGPVNWDVDGGDWDCFQQGTSVEDCGDGYINLLLGRPGRKGIFLHHDRLEFNVGIDGALLLAQYIVPRLKAEGISFSTMEELLDHEPTGDFACPFDTGMGGAAGAAGAGGAAQGGSAGTAGAGGVAGAGGAGGAINVAGMGGMDPMPPVNNGGGGTAATAGSAGAAGAVAQAAGAPAMMPVTPPPTTGQVEEASGCNLAHRGSSNGSWLALSALGLLLARRRRPSGGSRY